MRNRLESAAAALGLAIDEAAWRRIEQLVDLWRRYGKAVNLVGAATPEALAGHLEEAFATIACASRLVPLTEGTGWLDVGSGGGLPGLVVAAIAPCRLVLVEPRQKRSAFLELAVSTIGGSAVVFRGRVDAATWNEVDTEREEVRAAMPFSVASARAVFSPDAWLALAENLVMDGGAVMTHTRRGIAAVGSRAADAVVEVGDYAALGFRRIASDVPRGT